MKLWLLRPIAEWDPWYDKCFGIVVRAPNELEARIIGSGEAGDEGKEVWMDKKKTTCKELKQHGKKEVVIRDFASA